MTDEEMKTASGQLVEAMERIAAKHGWSGDDVISWATFALGELIARRMGVFGAVEQLRNAADVFERQAFEQSGS